jgi:hypothetical protein
VEVVTPDTQRLIVAAILDQLRAVPKPDSEILRLVALAEEALTELLLPPIK